MADLLAKFRLVDEMSSKLSTIAESGQNMLTQWESAGETANEAFGDISGAASATVSAVDGVAASVDGLRNVSDNAASSTEMLSNSLDSGEDTFKKYEAAIQNCEQSSDKLLTAIDGVEKNENSLSATMEKATKISEKLSNSDKISAETKEKLATASQNAENAMSALSEAQQRADEAINEVSTAQQRAEEAMSEYREAQNSGTESADKLAEALEKVNRAAVEVEAANRVAEDATEALTEANDRASNSARELSNVTKNASEEAKKGSKNGKDAIEALQNALASAGIVKGVKEIADTLMEASAAAAQTETAYAKLQSIAGSSPMDQLTKEIKELSAETGIEQEILADVTYNAISAGSAVENSVSTAGSAAKLAAAGFTETSSALSVLSTAMNSYGDAAGTAEEISDSLIIVQNLGVTTVAELSASMGKSISTAAAYNVSLGNLESSYVSVTKAGINTAEATTYISGMLSELGKDGSTVATILQEKTGQSFGQLMSEGYSLADVLGIIYDAAGNDAEAMMNLWSSQTAGVASAAIVNQGLEQFNANLEAIENSAGATESAYSIMANTTEHAQQKMMNSANNLKIAVGDSLNPALEKLYNLGSSAFQWAADFAEEHPNVVRAATAVAVGVGAIAIAIAGFTFVSKVAIPALTSFGVALNTALGPIGWVALAITGIVAAGTALVAMMNDAEDETANMTAITKAQYYQLQDLNEEYEKTCELYGENSEEALRLRYQVDDLSEAFEANRQTVEEFQAEVEELCTGVNDLWNEFDKSIAEINDNEVSALALIQKYDDLSQKAELTAGEQKQLAAVTESLAEKFPELTSKLDAATISTEAYVESLRKAAEQEAAQLRQQEIDDTYVKALAEREKLALELAKAEENLRLEEEAFNSVNWAWLSDQAIYQATGWDPFNVTNIDEYEEALEQVKAAIAENDAEIAELERDYEILAQAEKEAAEQQISDAEAVSIAYGGVREKIEDLCAAYDDAYQAALESFEGQFGLFDEASTQSEEYMNSTVENAQKALDSQLAYWDSYYENIETLKNISAGQLGVTQESYEALMSYVQDGSEQAAGLASSMVEAIKNGDTEAVKNLAETIGDISAKQEEIAASTADWQTNFETEMKFIEREMKVTVRNLDLSDEAMESAKSTITSYADQIRAGKGRAVEAANEVSDAVAAALLNAGTSADTNQNSSSVGMASGSVSGALTLSADGNLIPAHANGTTYSEEAFIAGENGPELIVGKQGSTVFPADETDRIISALNYRQRPLQVFADDNIKNNQDIPRDQEKRIRLEIAGSGTIEVSGSGKVDKETILELLKEHLEPVLMNLIEGEMYEEGELSYEY